MGQSCVGRSRAESSSQPGADQGGEVRMTAGIGVLAGLISHYPLHLGARIFSAGFKSQPDAQASLF